MSENLEAEENILGAMMLSSSAIDAVAEILTAPDFYRESHGAIFATALALHQADSPVTPVTIADAMEKSGVLAKIGGRPRLAELAALVPSTSNAPHYAKIVRELALVRGLIRAGQTITRLGTDRPGDLDDLIAQAEEALTSVTARNEATVTSMIDGLEGLLAELRQAYTTGIAMTGQLTHFKALDDILLGLWPGQLVVVAARPGHGKSTFALNIAENLCDQGVGALFASLEMGRRELQFRSLARAAKIDGLKLAAGRIDATEAARLKIGVEVVRGRANLHVEDDGGLTVQRLGASASRMVRTQGVGLIVVDYIQLITPPKAENRSNEVGAITRGLKLLARRLDVPIVALSQMNRNIEARQEKRPTLSDLRDSGSLEQDADVVLFLHDETAYDPDKPPQGKVEVIVAKNRRGPTDVAHMLYTRRLSTFMDEPKGVTVT